MSLPSKKKHPIKMIALSTPHMPQYFIPARMTHGYVKASKYNQKSVMKKFNKKANSLFRNSSSVNNRIIGFNSLHRYLQSCNITGTEDFDSSFMFFFFFILSFCSFTLNIERCTAGVYNRAHVHLVTSSPQ